MSNLGEFYFPIKREQLLEISTDNRFVLNEDLVADIILIMDEDIWDEFMIEINTKD